MYQMPVLLIDNKSSFGSRTMRIIYRHGGYDKFVFLSIYSEESRNLLMMHGFTQSNEKLMVLLDKGRVFIKSEAILRVSKKLNGAIPLLYTFFLIPGIIRDYVYDKIANYHSK